MRASHLLGSICIPSRLLPINKIAGVALVNKRLKAITNLIKIKSNPKNSQLFITIKRKTSLK
jgi:hypothetical protein